MILSNSFSPKSVMLFGMITQIFCGNMTGLVNSYELHVFFRCLSAMCCCQMYSAGQMICKFFWFPFFTWKLFHGLFFRSFWYYKREAKNDDNYTFRAILVGWRNSFTRLSTIFPELVSYLYGYIVANCDFNHTMEVDSIVFFEIWPKMKQSSFSIDGFQIHRVGWLLVEGSTKHKIF